MSSRYTKTAPRSHVPSLPIRLHEAAAASRPVSRGRRARRCRVPVDAGPAYLLGDRLLLRRHQQHHRAAEDHSRRDSTYVVSDYRSHR